MAVKRVNLHPRTLRFHLYCPHRFLSPSHSSSPSRCVSVLAAEDTRTVSPSPNDVTNMRHHESTSCMPCTAPCGSGPSSIIYCWIRLLLYMSSFRPLSCSFCPRPLTLYASFPSFTLAFCDLTSPHLLWPCARHLTFGYNSLICLQFEH